MRILSYSLLLVMLAACNLMVSAQCIGVVPCPAGTVPPQTPAANTSVRERVVKEPVPATPPAAPAIAGSQTKSKGTQPSGKQKGKKQPVRNNNVVLSQAQYNEIMAELRANRRVSEDSNKKLGTLTVWAHSFEGFAASQFKALQSYNAAMAPILMQVHSNTGISYLWLQTMWEWFSLLMLTLIGAGILLLVVWAIVWIIRSIVIGVRGQPAY